MSDSLACPSLSPPPSIMQLRGFLLVPSRVPLPLRPFSPPPLHTATYQVECPSCSDRRELLEALLLRLQLPVRFSADGVTLEAVQHPFVDHAYSRQQGESPGQVCVRGEDVCMIGDRGSGDPRSRHPGATVASEGAIMGCLFLASWAMAHHWLGIVARPQPPLPRPPSTPPDILPSAVNVPPLVAA